LSRARRGVGRRGGGEELEVILRLQASFERNRRRSRSCSRTRFRVDSTRHPSTQAATQAATRNEKQKTYHRLIIPSISLTISGTLRQRSRPVLVISEGRRGQRVRGWAACSLVRLSLSPPRFLRLLVSSRYVCSLARTDGSNEGSPITLLSPPRYRRSSTSPTASPSFHPLSSHPSLSLRLPPPLHFHPVFIFIFCVPYPLTFPPPWPLASSLLLYLIDSASPPFAQKKNRGATART